MKHIDLEQSDKYCIFRCGGTAYGLPAQIVCHVLECPGITPIPLSTSALVGLANVHQEFLTVFSLQQFLEPNSKQSDLERQQMLVIEHHTGRWAILVDQVEALASVEVSINTPINATQIHSDFVIGSTTCKDMYVTVIDADALLNRLISEQHNHWSQKRVQPNGGLAPDAQDDNHEQPDANPALA
jgi:chemotaxis signal transduction protein